MRWILLITISALSIVQLRAKDTLQVKQWAVSEALMLEAPILIDTFNTAGKKINQKMTLATKVHPTAFKRIKDIKNVDESGFISFNKTHSKDEFYFMSFQINAAQYTRAKLIVNSPHLFEIYVNGVKKGEKLVEQDQLQDAINTEVQLKLEPQQYTISIKYLSTAKSKINPSLKAFIISPKGTKDRFCISPEASASEQNKRAIRLADITEGERLNKVNVSPNGKYILSTSSLPLDNGKRKTIYNILEYTTGKIILTVENKELKWMPSGSSVFHLSETEDGKNLVKTEIPSMQSTILLEDIPESPFRWAPNEKFLIFSPVDKFVKDKTGVNRIFTPQDRQEAWRDRNSLCLYQLDKGIMEPLTFGFRSAYLIDISPDSKSILFSTLKDNYTQRPFSLRSFYLLDLESRKIDTLWQDIAYGNVMGFSPDGSQLLLTGGPESFNNIGLNIKLASIPNNYDVQAYIYTFATGKIKPITKDFNPSIKTAIWSNADHNIYFTVDDEDFVNCYKYSTSENTFTKLDLKVENVLQFDLAKNSLASAFIGQSTSYPGQLFKMDIKGKEITSLYNPQKERMKEIDLTPLNDWTFTSQQGVPIKGCYYLPPKFDASKKYPLIVYYYGGTTPVNRSFDSRYPFNLYAAMGYVVYVIQPSGAIGFGQDFSALHVNAWGKQTADDIIEGTQAFCKAHQFVNSSKVGCIGASYGGFMTMYLQTRTDIFAAAVSHAGISDVTSYWGEGYWGYAYNAVAAADSYPWNNAELYTKQSPLFAAQKINTPLLLLHGAADTNVPVGESLQMFTALKILGKDVELLTFEGENHFIIDSEKRALWQNSIFAWFAKWLQNNDAWWDDIHPDYKL